MSLRRKWPGRRSPQCLELVDRLQEEFVLDNSVVDKIAELTLKGEPIVLGSWDRFLHLGEVQIQEAAHVAFLVRFQSLLNDGLDEAVHAEASLADRPVAGSVGE